MRCASKRSPAEGRAGAPLRVSDEGVAAATSAVKASHQSHQIDGVVVGDEPAGAGDGSGASDAGTRTSTSAFAEDASRSTREVARSIAAELLSSARDVFGVRRSGTVASSDRIVSSTTSSSTRRSEPGASGDTVTEPDETTSLLERLAPRVAPAREV